MSKENFTDLFKDLLLEVTAKDHGLFTGLDKFYKGIGEMKWPELMAGGQALRSVKENISFTMTGVNPALGERRNRWIKKIEHAFRVRILMLANEPHEIINMGMSRWEEAIAVFGKEFFENVETPIHTPVVEAPRSPNAPPVVSAPVTEEKLKELLRKTEEYLETRLKSIRENISNIRVPEVKIPGGLMFAVWASFVLNLVLIGVLAMTYLSVKSIPEDIDANHQLILKVKSRVESHDKSFKRDSIALVSIQDTLNVRLPKAKAKK